MKNEFYYFYLIYIMFTILFQINH